MPITRPVKGRKQVMRSTTVREFNGGWNVVDNDLNLSPKFAKILTNMSRLPDGTIGIRYGTRLIGDLSESVVHAATLGTNPLATTNSSGVIVVTHASHNMITGHTVTLAGAATTNGITNTYINTSHIITRIDENSYSIATGGTASSTGSGGGSSVTYSQQNNGADGKIINMIYFQDRIVMVLATGNVIEADDDGNSRIIWNDDISNEVASASGWGTTAFASFAIFNGELIICNGVNKPLVVNFNEDIPCNYLVDEGTNSNANTPICRYVIAINNYVVMAGDYANPSRIYISNKGTSGTFFGDADPNDAVNVDVGKVAQSQTGIIRGISRFRETLVVAFDDVIALGKLGIYGGVDNTEHKPDFSDVIGEHGTVAHRSIVNLGDDVLMCDNIGVPSLARAQFTGSLRPERVSQMIDPEIQASILSLTIGAAEDRVFAVYNQREGQYMLFVPNTSDPDTTSETKCYVFTSIKTQRISAWSLYRGWNFSCACLTALKRIIFAQGRKYYVYGSTEDPIYSDLLNDLDIDIPEEGNAIDFTWELPWADFNERMKNKHLRHIYFDAKGSANFTADVFIDNIYYDPVNANYAPTLSMVFQGGDSIGFGAGEQPYGGDVRASDERSWAFITKFRIMKLRVSGSAKEPLRIVAVSFNYHMGSGQR